jgi:hypothetical protein
MTDGAEIYRWVRIDIKKLAWFCHEAPASVRWSLERKPGTRRLQVKTKNGRLDFKLSGGCWLRKQMD